MVQCNLLRNVKVSPITIIIPLTDFLLWRGEWTYNKDAHCFSSIHDPHFPSILSFYKTAFEQVTHTMSKYIHISFISVCDIIAN